jgi:SP family facilitated glucose transporter-like MFS transporter 8
MAAAFPVSTAPRLPLRHSAAGTSLAFRLGRSRPARLDGGCALRLPAAAAGATCGRTRRAPAVAAAQGQAAAGEGIHDSAGKGSLRMVLLSTAVAVCGSFEFGTCVSRTICESMGISGITSCFASGMAMECMICRLGILRRLKLEL